MRTVLIKNIPVCYGMDVVLIVDLFPPDPDNNIYKEYVGYIKMVNPVTNVRLGEATFNRLMDIEGELARIETLIYEKIDAGQYEILADAQTTIH